jgi:PIN domain nuclease of toxin-antitoxin system
MLATKRRGHATLRFLPDASTWFDRVMNAPGIRLAQFTPSIAMTASFLPGDLHNDPADRLLVSTARHLGMPIVTGDGKIIAYAEQGFVKVLPC